MRTFAQKQNPPQMRASSLPARSNTATPARHHRADLILHLQRAIGNQALQRMLQTNAGELEVGSSATASPRLDHDVSRIPIYPPTTKAIQAKPALNQPGDDYEQEADHISKQVSHISEPKLQRACACGGGCAECQTEQSVQQLGRMQTKGDGSSDLGQTLVPSTVHEVLASPGQPLHAATRTALEGQFGHDFARVQIHADERAAAAADVLRAHAFTVGEHVAFAEGRYAPSTQAGRQLLAHELAHVVQQAPGRAAPHASGAQAEREADAAAAAPRRRVPLSTRVTAVHRQPAPAKTGMTRGDLAKKLKAIFGHDVTIEVGNKERQTRELSGPRDKRTLPDDWKAWDPGESTPLYDEILGAIEDFGRDGGGVPDITQIVFYDVHYGYDEHDNVVADTDAAAAIRGRVMFVYSAALFPTAVVAGGSGISTSGIRLASKRSTAGKKGVSAPMGPASRAESQRRSVAHELGHVVERATKSLREFEQAVGWVRVDGDLRLYDIQAKGVKEAIAKGTEPPATARITKRDWNSGTHLEQPMREYAVTDSTEDFADSMMAWLYARDVLKARSPARFKFFDDQARRKGWQPKLVTPGAAAAPRQGTP
jgi:Domain of unknown function (DUF4157)